MNSRNLVVRAFTVRAIMLAAAPVMLLAHSRGPDAGNCGVTGESTCAQCHTNSSGGSGSVAVSGFAAGMTYTPGVAQTLTVTVSDSTQMRWGFQLTARPSGNAQQQAGTFTPGTDGFTQLSCGQPPFSGGAFANEIIGNNCANSLSQFPLEYVEHTLAGTRLGQTGSATFTFTWTPPPDSSAGNIVVYVAGNAANGNNAPTGDHIYLNTYTLTPAATSGAPSISAVVNAAGSQATIEPGSWVAIYGSNLSSTTRQWQASDFTNNGTQEPTQLDNVSVTIGGQPAYVYYISPTQINVQAPAVGTGTANVVVTSNNVPGAPATTTVAPVSPACFPWPGNHVVATRTDFSLVGPPGLFTGGPTTTPAKPGDTIILWATGFGATTPPIVPGTLTPSTSATVNDPISVTVGNLPATVVGAALTPGEAGVYQIAIKVPANAPNGDLPLAMTIDTVQTQAGLVLTVQQ